MKSYNIKKVNPPVYNTNRIICFGSESFLNLSLSYANQNVVQIARPDKNMDIRNIMGGYVRIAEYYATYISVSGAETE